MWLSVDLGSIVIHIPKKKLILYFVVVIFISNVVEC